MWNSLSRRIYFISFNYSEVNFLSINIYRLIKYCGAKAEQITVQLRQFLKNEKSNTLNIYRKTGTISISLLDEENNQIQAIETNINSNLNLENEEEDKINFDDIEDKKKLGKNSEEKMELEDFKKTLDNY